MIKLVYWNIKKRANELYDEITSLSRGIDILIISELSISNKKLIVKKSSIQDVINTISNITGMKYKGNNTDSWLHVWARERDNLVIEQIDIFDKQWAPRDLVNKDSGNSEYLTDYLSKFERMIFYKIKYHKLEFLLVPIHFPSRMYASVERQKDIAIHFKEYIEKVEKTTELDSVVVGDFNMNPFEPGMIHPHGFHALPIRDIGENIKFIGGITYRTFYNPSWEKFGDFEIINNLSNFRPGGSYYHENSNDINYYWYVFDQVILRKSLVPNFCFEEFKYVSSLNNNNDLLNDNYSPNHAKYSDHLPLKFQIKN